MKVTQISVSAGRTFNHPYEQFSNLRPNVTVSAMLEEGEDFEKAVKELQAKAESLVEDHKNNMIETLHALRIMTQEEAELERLESTLKAGQERLEELRKNRKARKNQGQLTLLRGSASGRTEESPKMEGDEIIY